MPKYKCQCGCGNEKAVRQGCQAPECCGKPMIEVKKDNKDGSNEGCCCCG